MIWTAFTIGLLGSLHCVGMCGPLMLALPFSKKARVGRLLLYNTGRISTYTFLGAIMGFLGKGVFMVGLQAWLTLIIGIAFVAIALFSLNVELKIWETPFFASLYVKIKSAFARLVNRSGVASIYSLGLLNGLLPCGLVYLALAGALTQNSWTNGMLYMLVFGLGTLPLLLAFTLLGQMASHRWRNYLNKAYPFVLGAMGVFLIWRALQFQLPADFSLWETVNNAPMCH